MAGKGVDKSGLLSTGQAHERCTRRLNTSVSGGDPDVQGKAEDVGKVPTTVISYGQETC